MSLSTVKRNSSFIQTVFRGSHRIFWETIMQQILYSTQNWISKKCQKMPKNAKNSKIVLTKKDITEFVRNLFYFFFLRCFSSSCMFASIIQKEKIDVFHSIFLFTWKIMLLTYFPSKRWNATFINCHRVRKKKAISNEKLVLTFFSTFPANQIQRVQ